MSESENKVDIELGVTLEGLESGIKEAKEQIEGLAEPIRGVVDAFGELGEAFLAALAVEKIEEFADRMGELGESTERMGKILGVSTEQIGELNFAAEMTGTSTDNLAVLMGRFEAGLSEAEKGTGRMAAGLRSLGLSAKELQELNPSQQLREIAEAVSKVGDGAAKAAALQDLGRGFVQLIPLLDEGGEGFDELSGKAREAGVVLSGETTASLVEMQHGLVGLKEDIQGATISGFAPFIGVVNVAVGGMSDLAKAFTDSAAHGGAVKQVLDALADGFRVIEQLIADTIAAVKVFGATIEYTITVAKAKFDELGNAIIGVVNDLAHLDLGFSHTAAAAHEGAQDAAAAWKEAAATIKSAMDENAAAQAKIWKGSPLAAAFGYRPGVDPRGGEAAGVPTGGADSSFKPQPPMPVEQTKGKQDNSALKAAEEEASTEIKLWTDAATKKEALLDGELKRHEISTAQWLSGTKDALADELQDTIATYQKELQTANLTAQQRKAISDKMAEAIAANETKIVKAEQKAADETAAAWKSAADKVSGIMNSQVDALLTGTETLAQAFRNMFVMAVEEIIKSLIQLGVELVFVKGLETALGVGGGGGGGGGPLGTLFHTLGIPGFAEGSWELPHDTVAMVHAGEMVVPAGPAAALRSAWSVGGSNGSGDTHNYAGDTHNYHIHIHSNSADPREVAKQVAKHWDANPSARPKY